MASSHEIGNLNFNIKGRDDPERRSILHELLPEILEKYFDKYDRYDKVVVIDRIDFDLGTIRAENFREEIIVRLSYLLESELKKFYSLPNIDTLIEDKVMMSNIDAFVEYAGRGYSKFSHKSMSDLFQELLNSDFTLLSEVMRQLLNHPDSYTRLRLQVDQKYLNLYWSKVLPIQYEEVRKINVQILKDAGVGTHVISGSNELVSVLNQLAFNYFSDHIKGVEIKAGYAELLKKNVDDFTPHEHFFKTSAFQYLDSLKERVKRSEKATSINPVEIISSYIIEGKRSANRLSQIVRMAQKLSDNELDDVVAHLSYHKIDHREYGRLISVFDKERVSVIVRNARHTVTESFRDKIESFEYLNTLSKELFEVQFQFDDSEVAKYMSTTSSKESLDHLISGWVDMIAIKKRIGKNDILEKLDSRLRKSGHRQSINFRKSLEQIKKASQEDFEPDKRFSSDPLKAYLHFLRSGIWVLPDSSPEEILNQLLEEKSELLSTELIRHLTVRPVWLRLVYQHSIDALRAVFEIVFGSVEYELLLRHLDSPDREPLSDVQKRRIFEVFIKSKLESKDSGQIPFEQLFDKNLQGLVKGQDLDSSEYDVDELIGKYLIYDNKSNASKEEIRLLLYSIVKRPHTLTKYWINGNIHLSAWDNFFRIFSGSDLRMVLETVVSTPSINYSLSKSIIDLIVHDEFIALLTKPKLMRLISRIIMGERVEVVNLVEKALKSSSKTFTTELVTLKQNFLTRQSIELHFMADVFSGMSLERQDFEKAKADLEVLLETLVKKGSLITAIGYKELILESMPFAKSASELYGLVLTKLALVYPEDSLEFNEKIFGDQSSEKVVKRAYQFMDLVYELVQLESAETKPYFKSFDHFEKYFIEYIKASSQVSLLLIRSNPFKLIQFFERFTKRNLSLIQETLADRFANTDFRLLMEKIERNGKIDRDKLKIALISYSFSNPQLKRSGFFDFIQEALIQNRIVLSESAALPYGYLNEDLSVDHKHTDSLTIDTTTSAGLQFEAEGSRTILPSEHGHDANTEIGSDYIRSEGLKFGDAIPSIEVSSYVESVIHYLRFGKYIYWPVEKDGIVRAILKSITYWPEELKSAVVINGGEIDKTISSLLMELPESTHIRVFQRLFSFSTRQTDFVFNEINASITPHIEEENLFRQSSFIVEVLSTWAKYILTKQYRDISTVAKRIVMELGYEATPVVKKVKKASNRVWISANMLISDELIQTRILVRDGGIQYTLGDLVEYISVRNSIPFWLSLPSDVSVSELIISGAKKSSESVKQVFRDHMSSYQAVKNMFGILGHSGMKQVIRQIEPRLNSGLMSYVKKLTKMHSSLGTVRNVEQYFTMAYVREYYISDAFPDDQIITNILASVPHDFGLSTTDYGNLLKSSKSALAKNYLKQNSRVKENNILSEKSYSANLLSYLSQESKWPWWVNEVDVSVKISDKIKELTDEIVINQPKEFVKIVERSTSPQRIVSIINRQQFDKLLLSIAPDFGGFIVSFNILLSRSNVRYDQTKWFVYLINYVSSKRKFNAAHFVQASIPIVQHHMPISRNNLRQTLLNTARTAIKNGEMRFLPFIDLMGETGDSYSGEVIDHSKITDEDAAIYTTDENADFQLHDENSADKKRGSSLNGENEEARFNRDFDTSDIHLTKVLNIIDALSYYLHSGSLPIGVRPNVQSYSEFRKALQRHQHFGHNELRMVVHRELKNQQVRARLIKHERHDFLEILVSILFPSEARLLTNYRNKLTPLLQKQFKNLRHRVIHELYYKALFEHVLNDQYMSLTTADLVIAFIDTLASHVHKMPIFDLEELKRLGFEPQVIKKLMKEAVPEQLGKVQKSRVEVPKVEEVEEVMVDHRVLVKNAGLVIVWPYLTRYFSLLEMTEDDQFISREMEVRAIHLLQFIATGTTVAPEHELLLNKVLANVAISTPVPLEAKLTDKEIETTEMMLKGVIQNWERLKGSSIQALREGFLTRDGYIFETEKTWELKVEKKTLDILMESMPWSFGTIKLPWMEKRLNVEWL